MPLIADDNIFALGTFLFGLAWLGFWVDTHPIGKKTSGVVWVLMVAMLFSNLRIIPLSSPAYDFVGGSLVPTPGTRTRGGSTGSAWSRR